MSQLNANEVILNRAAQEVTQDLLVNLGIGLPQQLTQHLAAAQTPMILSENGLIGVGKALPHEQANAYCMDAGGAYVDVVPGASFVDSAMSFGLIRGGYVDLAFLGAFQVSQFGDLANWHVPGAKKTGMGGALEIASCAKKLVVLMRHQDKQGRAKILSHCTFPLTSRRCVNRIITEQAVFDIDKDGLILRETLAGYCVEAIKANTEAPFRLAPDLT